MVDQDDTTPADEFTSLVWTLLPGDARPRVPDLQARGALCFGLDRRGVDHGILVVGDQAPTPTDDPGTAFRSTQPVFLPDLLTDSLAERATDIARTLRSFEDFRDGTRLLEDLDRRLQDQEHFEYSSSTIDTLDPREIEKVFVDARDPDHPTRRRIARDLSAKLSWISHDEDDRSMRIRFSFGHESTGDWLEGGLRAQWSDRFCDAAFPERRAVTQSEAVRGVLGACLERPWRLSETIVYSNAPGGGAVFHHDADDRQRGVLFVQCHGVTVWLALANRELAELLGVTIEHLDQADDALRRRLDRDPELTQALAERNALFALGPGDALLLPSFGTTDCCWHSVFGTEPIGEDHGPSLGLSFAIFDAVDEPSTRPPDDQPSPPLNS